jgi:hypothetical protein
MSVSDRVRKVDIDKLPEEDLKNLEVSLGNKLKTIFEETISKSNRYLNVYGLRVLIKYEVVPLTDNLNTQTGTDPKES